MCLFGVIKLLFIPQNRQIVAKNETFFATENA